MKTSVLISKHKRENRSIIIRISFGAYLDDAGKKRYRPIDYYTGLSVRLEDWNKKRLRTRNSDTNTTIEDAISRIGDIHARLLKNEKLTYDTFKKELQTDDELNKILQKDIRVTESNTEHYMPPYEYLYIQIEKKHLTAGTKTDYHNTIQHMKNFEAESGKPFSWKSAGYDYYLEFVDYLKGINLRPSTINKVVKNLKVFLNWADSVDNIQVNQDFKKRIGNKSLFAKIEDVETEHVYLDENEIRRITDLNIENKKLSEIRDLFIIGCWTGLRISDLTRLRLANINDDIVSITAKKTNTTIAVPVTKELQNILDKYPDELPTAPTDQHFNREIKKVCELAGINEPVLQDIRKGSLRTQAFVPKHKLITAHTARRSFATNLFRRRIPSTQLMMLTGHKTEKAFLQYIKVSPKENAQDVGGQLKKIG